MTTLQKCKEFVDKYYYKYNYGYVIRLRKDIFEQLALECFCNNYMTFDPPEDWPKLKEVRIKNVMFISK